MDPIPRWKIMAVCLGVIVIAACGALYFWGKYIPGYENLVFQVEFYWKGGTELLVEPDYRLSGPALRNLGQTLFTKNDPHQIPTSNIDLIGFGDNRLYDGLKFTFLSNTDAERVMKTKVIPAKYRLEAFGRTRNLKISSRAVNNTIELTVTQDPLDYPNDLLDRYVTILNYRVRNTVKGKAILDKDKGQIRILLPGMSPAKVDQKLITTIGYFTMRIKNQIVLDGRDLKNVACSFNTLDAGYKIDFEFEGEGAKQLAWITTNHIGQNMGVYLDETVLMEPVIETALTDGRGIIVFSGSTWEEVEKYAMLIKAGALPVPPRIIMITQVKPLE
jgi:preprotein translocase subunit SecD